MFLSRWLFPPIDIGPRVDPYVPSEPAPVTFEMEPIRPGDPEWYFNGADAGCELCGGHGRVSRTVDGRRQFVPCVCFDASRCA